jgi:anti-sigma-K factor RskA
MSRELAAGDIHALAGAYVLDALSDTERAAFARHIRTCETCAFEVAELHETTARMAGANWSVPPPRMRHAVLASAARTRQVSPGREDPVHRQATSALWRRTATAVAAAVLAAGIGGATWSLDRQRLHDEHARVVAEQRHSHQVSEVLSAGDARLHRNGRVSIVVAASRNAGVAVLTDLPDPGRTRAYQLWAIRTGVTTSVGLLGPSQRAATVLVGGMSGADTFGVSLEPAGGSPQPTVIVATVALA